MLPQSLPWRVESGPQLIFMPLAFVPWRYVCSNIVCGQGKLEGMTINQNDFLLACVNS